MGLTLRPADAGDLETLLEIQKQAAVRAFAHVFDQERYPFPVDDIREVWRETIADPQIELYIGEVGGKPAGSVAVGEEFLRTLYVLPDHQGAGVGSRLHDHALDRLRAHGVQIAKLWTLEENWPARKFYERRGWELTAETRVVPYPPNPIDVQYAKDL